MSVNLQIIEDNSGINCSILFAGRRVPNLIGIHSTTMSVLKVQKRKKHEKVGRRISQPVERTSAATSWYLGPPGERELFDSSGVYKRSSASALLPSPKFGRSGKFER